MRIRAISRDRSGVRYLLTDSRDHSGESDILTDEYSRVKTRTALQGVNRLYLGEISCILYTC